MSGEKYWLTPPDLYKQLSRQFGPFDYDPCPYPLPDGFDGLKEPWGASNYVNPPFRPADVLNTDVKRPGPTAFVHKAIEEQKKGNSSLIVAPVQSYVMLLAAAGAQIVSLGRVGWLDTETGEAYKSPSPICAFFLEGDIPF